MSPTYLGPIIEGHLSRSCGRLRGSIGDALGCAQAKDRHPESAVTVVGAEMGADGVTRYRDFMASERAELTTLQGGR